MASPNSTFDEIVTTTLRKHRREIADNVSENNALYKRLTKRGKVKLDDGGSEIAIPLDYAENSTYQRYSGLDVLNIGSSEVLSAAKYDWKQAAIHVVISGRELRQNSGSDTRIINLLEARIENAKRTAANNMSEDLYSSGSLTNQVGGIQHIIQDAGGGTVGGIVSTTYTWWKNQFEEAAGTVSKTTIKKEMMDLWLKTCRGSDKTDLIVGSTELFTLYWEALSDLQRFASTEEGDTGFTTLKFMSADVVYDSLASGMPATHMFFINTNYMQLVTHRDANWTVVEDKVPLQQDAIVKPLLWMGNLTCSNRARQGVLIDASG